MKRRVLSLIILAAMLLTSCGLRRTDGAKVTTAAPDTTQNTDDTSPDTTQPADTEPAAPDASVSFAACGDNIIYFGTFRDAAAQAYAGGRTYNFAPIYENVKSIITNADIAFINQETPVSQSFQPESYPTFNSPVDLTYDVMDVGFDVINMANNHMLDKGALGLRESFDNWNARSALVIGCYEEKSSGRYITYTEKNGISIAYVSYTYGTNLNEDPANKGLWAPYLKQSDVAGDVAEAAANADFVIVSVHWGDEGAMTPNDEQKKYAKIMADAGADVIIGHHPHVLQPIEWLDGKDGKKVLCAYSLGNFVHEQAFDYNVPGGILTFNMTKKSGKTAVENTQFIPTVCHYPSNFYNNKIYLLKDYTQELAASHAVATYYHNSISLASLKKYVTDTIPSEFLTDYMN